MAHLSLRRKQPLSAFRKMALGTWRPASDPTVYGKIRIRMDEALAYIDAYRKASGRRLTVSHLVARAYAQVLSEMPDANAIVRFGRLYLREKIAVFFQVALEERGSGELDLSGLCLESPHEKSFAQVLAEFEARAAVIREYEDKQLEQTRALLKRMPWFFVAPFLRLVSFLSYTLNLDLRWAGLPADPFGSVLITNVGSLGLSEAWAPLVPYTRVPVILATGAVAPTPIVQGGEVIVAQVMDVCATFDHRVMDGALAAKLARRLTEILEKPRTYFEVPEAAPTPVRPVEAC